MISDNSSLHASSNTGNHSYSNGSWRNALEVFLCTERPEETDWHKIQSKQVRHEVRKKTSLCRKCQWEKITYRWINCDLKEWSLHHYQIILLKSSQIYLHQNCFLLHKDEAKQGNLRWYVEHSLQCEMSGVRIYLTNLWQEHLKAEKQIDR